MPIVHVKDMSVSKIGLSRILLCLGLSLEPLEHLQTKLNTGTREGTAQKKYFFSGPTTKRGGGKGLTTKEKETF